MDINLLTSNKEHYTIPLKTQNENLVRTTITKNDHPHPGLLIIIVIIILVLLYYIQTTFIKQNLSGEWYLGDKALKIKHNMYNDKITVTGLANESTSGPTMGHIAGNAVYLDMANSTDKTMGVYRDKKIYWVGSTDVWKRPTIAI